jgi:transcriptional antiterminator RfaH
MSSGLISTQQAADRLGLTTSALHELRWRDDGLSIVQQGLVVGYRLADLQAFEEREVLAVVRQVMASERPLPLIRAITAAVMSQPASQQGAITPSAPMTPVPVLPPAGPGSSSLTWHLVHTKPRQEAIALTHLSRQGYECYLPMFKVERVRQRKCVLVSEAMFPRYLFVRTSTSSTEQSLSPIRSTVGVTQLVRFGGQPARVDSQIIDHIRYRETSQTSKPAFAPGEQVVVTHGPFAGLEALYQTKEAEKRSLILLEILSQSVALRIDTAQLRKAG